MVLSFGFVNVPFRKLSMTPKQELKLSWWTPDDGRLSTPTGGLLRIVRIYPAQGIQVHLHDRGLLGSRSLARDFSYSKKAEAGCFQGFLHNAAVRDGNRNSVRGSHRSCDM
jgi:hypothetical protein